MALTKEEQEHLDWLVKTGQAKNPAPVKVATPTENEAK